MQQSRFRNHPDVEMVQLASLRPNPKHPRKHKPKQVNQLARVIERFGWLVPIVCEDDGLIVAGHLRWLAGTELGLDEVPVIRARFVSEADRRAFVLADSRIAEKSEWDEDQLKAEFEYLFEQDFDLSITGFELSDLDLGIADETPKEELVELPDPVSAAVSRPGDLWLIGLHRLYNGNARDTSSYEALLAGELASMVFSDPPYNVPIANHVSGLGRVTHREFAEASGEMSSSEYTSFLRVGFRNCVRFSTDGSIHYHCIDWRHIREMMDAGDGVYTQLKQMVVWTKSGNAGMGTLYRSQHELVLVYKSGRARHINNFGLGDTGRYRTNVWDYAGANTFRKGRARDLNDHPTVKPVAMVADAILDCSNRGDLILDPFSGSATTLLAAHRTKRRGAAIEIDPLFVDTGLRRLSAATGLIPTLSDGRTFDEVAADRALEQETDNG